MTWAGRWGRWGLVALSGLLILLTFLPAWQTDRWWVRQWDYPRLQIAALLLVAGLALLWASFKRDRYFWALLGGTVAAFGWQLTHFAAYIPPWPHEVASAKECAPDRQISLLNANVLQTNKDYAALLRLVAARDPDVLLLLETGPQWAKAVAPLRARYPYRLQQPVPTTYGMMLFSRLPMTGEVRNLLQPGVPSMATQLRLPGGEKVDFYALHPEPPLPGDDSGERDAELISVGREVRDRGRAAIVMGDLNDVAWSRTSRLFKKVAGMGDPRVGRGFYPTFNASYPLLRWPLDHLFISPHFEVMGIDLQRDIGSDHFPILFSLCLTDRAASRKVPRDAGPATEAKASEEVREGRKEKSDEDRGQ